MVTRLPIDEMLLPEIVPVSVLVEVALETLNELVDAELPLRSPRIELSRMSPLLLLLAMS